MYRTSQLAASCVRSALRFCQGMSALTSPPSISSFCQKNVLHEFS